jgi:hypothetical protein
LRIEMMNVYFVKAFGKPPRMKIGKAADVEQRIRELQTGCPYELKLMATIKCRSDQHAFQVERLAHEFFKEFRTRGEWFKCTDYVVCKAFEFETVALATSP